MSNDYVTHSLSVRPVVPSSVSMCTQTCETHVQYVLLTPRCPAQCSATAYCLLTDGSSVLRVGSWMSLIVRSWLGGLAAAAGRSGKTQRQCGMAGRKRLLAVLLSATRSYKLKVCVEHGQFRLECLGLGSSHGACSLVGVRVLVYGPRGLL